MDNGFIAPVANPRQTAPNKFLVIGGLVLLVVAVVIGFFMLMGNSNSYQDTVTRANARLSGLTQLVDLGQESAESADLRKIMSEASLLLTGDTVTFAQAGVSENQQIIAEESEAKRLEQLTTAAVNGQFDMVFVPVIIEKYEDTNAIMQEVKSSRAKLETRQAASKIIEHNDAMLAQLRDLTL